MNNISKLRSYLPLVIYLFINSIFIIKYSVRYSLSPTILILIYSIIVIGVILLLKRKKEFFKKLSRSVYFTFCIVTFVLLTILMFQFDITEIRVSRHAAIQEWLGNFLRGEFPYGGTANPSSFPVLFITFIPFKLIGELGLMQMLTYLLFSFYLLKRFTNAPNAKWFIQILLLSSPIYLYEIVTRSELFSNMVFVMLFVHFLLRNESIPEEYQKLIFASVFGGLILSTRMIVLPIYFIFLFYFYRENLKKLFLLFLGIGIVFLLTNLPFYLWNPHLYIEKGPFAVQSIYLSKVVVLLFLVLAVIIGFKIKSERSLHFATALLLFFIVFSAFITQLSEHTLFELIYKDRFDLAYFIFPLPFLLLSINSNRL